MPTSANSSTLPLRAFALGLVCGMRSLLGPALVRPRAAKAADRQADPLLRAAANPQAAALLPILSVGELVGDKLPFAPNRTEPGSVVFRSLSGAAVGATLYTAEAEPIAVGVALGVAGALTATYGMFFLRRAAQQRTGLPSAVLGAVEDVLALSIGLTALRGIED